VQRFDGFIAGLGTSSGLRAVVGHWPRSPLGTFTDVMVEQDDGHRVLVAPDLRVAEFVAATYTFDEIRIEPVTTRVEAGRWTVDASSLALSFTVGRRTALGALLRAVPLPLATHPRWIGAIDAVARRVLPGVRTRGSAGGGREDRRRRSVGRRRPRRARPRRPARAVRVRVDAPHAVARPDRHAGAGLTPATATGAPWAAGRRRG
jgi:hypothetical protein